MTEQEPQATELVYVPEPSWDPAVLAVGLGLFLAGLFVWWPYGAIGVVMAIVAIVRMISATEDNVERLPRRQKLTTAVLPPVERKSS